MKWQSELEEGIRKSLASDTLHTIGVHNEEQANTGEMMVPAMARAMGKHYLRVNFTVMPDSIRDFYPVGCLDPPKI